MYKVASKCISALLLLLVSFQLFASPKYQWHDRKASETRAIAEDFLSSDHGISEFTRIAVKADIRIEDDEVIETIKSVWFYPNQTDIDSDGNHYIYWDSQVESLTVKEAGVIGPAGHYQRVNSDNVRIVADDSYNIFTDTKKVVIPYSGLSAGYVSVLEYEFRYRLSSLESNWFFSMYSNTNQPTLSFDLTAQSNSIELVWSQVGNSVKCDGDSHKVSCSGKNVTAYKGDSGVFWRDIIDYVYIGSQSDWKSVVDHSLTAFNKAELDSPEVDKIFNKLVGELGSTVDKIDAIQNYVARDIRYLSLSELGHRMTPHTVAFVDENRFGDCKDKTAAAVALFRKLGLVAYPVLVSAKRSDPSVLTSPSANFFNHMIACFEFEGRRYCIDATDPDTHWSAISSWIQGSVILPLKNDSKPIRLLDDKPRWEFSFHTEIKFDERAYQSEFQNRIYHASYAGDMRNSLRSASSNERIEKMLSQYHANVSDTVEPEFQFKEIDSLSDKLEVHSSVEYPDFLTKGEELDYTERDHWLRYELLSSRLSTEHNDTEFAGLNLATSYRFDVSALWKLSRLPASLSLKGDFGEMTRKVTLEKDGKVLVQTNTVIPRQTILQNKISEFNDYLNLLVSETDMNMQGELLTTSN